jgi:hypothetical protein
MRQPQTLGTPPPPHELGAMHGGFPIAQLTMVPQPSLIEPQFEPGGQVLGVHVPMPQIFGPPAPHVSSGPQSPQSKGGPPHGSSSIPQRPSHVSTGHAHVPPVQISPIPSQPPQSIVPPQPFQTSPQCPGSQKLGSQSQIFAMPPLPHVSGASQSPHSMAVPHPSSIVPHSARRPWQSSGVHPAARVQTPSAQPWPGGQS